MAEVSGKVFEQVIADRIEDVEQSVRTQMMRVADTLDEVIKMGRGDPDLDTPPHIVEAAQEALAAGKTHYSSPEGIPELREAIAAKLRDENGLDYHMKNVMVTTGGQQAIMLTLLGILNPGEEILVSSPRFNSYDVAAELAGGRVVSVPTYERDNFALKPEEVEKRISPRTRILVVITPNNPTGGIIPLETLKGLADLAKKHNLIVISDEIYEKQVYDGNEHVSFGTLPGMLERTVTINGFSKGYAMTGFRIGYMASPNLFIEKLVEAKHSLDICTTSVSQAAALAALEGSQDCLEEFREIYDERRKFMMGVLDDCGITYGYPGGAFYIYANVSSTGVNAPEFCLSLLQEEGVMIFPGALFADHSNDHIRISLLAPMDQMEEAAERMKRHVERLRAENDVG
jgi:aminotransferase